MVPTLIVHFVVSLRWHRPRTRVLIAKYDYSDAYSRVAHSAGVAAQTIAVHEGMAYLALRLTFGGSLEPPPDTVHDIRDGHGPGQQNWPV